MRTSTVRGAQLYASLLRGHVCCGEGLTGGPGAGLQVGVLKNNESL